jgi:hypothetical protein
MKDVQDLSLSMAHCRLELLEMRRLLCSTHDELTGARHRHHGTLGTFAADYEPVLPPPPPSLMSQFASAATAGPALVVPLTDVPVLNSHPGAPASLYLDFVGDDTADWGGLRPGHTPALDQDGDPTTFSQAELDTIRGAWAAVAEDYSPFSLNVTTVDPGNRDDFKTMEVVIGGNGAWYGQPAGGVSFIDSFHSPDPNVAYVFINTDANNIGAAISHEAGHGFGLQHQSVFDATGAKTDEYSRGDGTSAPIMGYGYLPRQTWWQGSSSLGAQVSQDDVSVIASSANGFGYRPDDAPDAPASAKKLTAASATNGVSVFSTSGVIERSTDQDWYSFTTTAAGSVTAAVDVAPQFANLDARLELRNSAGTLIASSDTESLGEAITVTLAPGTYRLGVMSRHYSDGSGAVYERHGDIGQYTVRVDAPNPPQQSPHLKTPFAISATGATTIQLEDYDNGGESIAYHDTTAANTGGWYRTGEGVDLKPAGDVANNYRLGDVAAGEWVEYTINVAQAGAYTFDLRASSPGAGASLHVAVDDADVSGSLSVPNTGGWSRYATISKSGVNLAAGTHVLRVAFDTVSPATGLAGGFDSIRVTKSAPASTTLTLNSSAAAHVRDGQYAAQNFGTDPQLELKRSSVTGYAREAYLLFDLTSVTSITSAVLRLFGGIESNAAQNLGLGVFAMSNTAATWDQHQLTWNNRPPSTTQPIATTTITDATMRWYSLDVTTYLKSQKAAGRTSVTLVLKMTTYGSKRVLVNSDDAAMNRPQLQIKT